ncbi:MAG: hypothetical protein JSR53_09425 [Proteobacteria bacterium]|nr:hypothetical protein [Pseudomonadota bacterium]
MDVDFIIDRLRQGNLPVRQIGGAAELDAAMGGVVTPPALFVLPLAERTVAGPLLGLHQETDTAEFGVLLCVANVQGARGQQALAQLAPLRAAVRALLSGWAPARCNGVAMVKQGGQLLRFDGDARMWWMDRFSCQFYYRS